MDFLRKTVTSAAIVFLIVAGGCNRSGSRRPVFNKPGDPEAIREMLKPSVSASRQDGIAAAILLDTTGSMKDVVKGADRKEKAKLQVAQEALLNLIRQFSDFAQKHPERKLLVSIYEFSTRPNQPSCRQIVKMGAPDGSVAQAAIAKLAAEGSTPIGDAMIVAKRDLDATGYSRRHILVITDGENNRGYMPGDVARVISTEPEAERAAIYFIAFDLSAEVFEPVKDAGGLVLAAEGEQQLTDTLDYILTGKILVEQPVSPAAPPHPPIGIRK